MWDLKTIAAIVLAISLITFIALFGRLPYFRYLPISFAYIMAKPPDLSLTILKEEVLSVCCIG